MGRQRSAGVAAVHVAEERRVDVVPEQLLEAYNTGDYLHPNVAGFQAIVDKFPLNVFDLRL